MVLKACFDFMPRIAVYSKGKNLGASPQLECWNTGMLEYWVMGNWNNALLAMLILTREFINEIFPF
jgi:hypothetical protein